MALINTNTGHYFRLKKDNSPFYLQGEIYKDAKHREDFKNGDEFTAMPKGFVIDLRDYNTDFEAILLTAQRDYNEDIESDKIAAIYKWVKGNLTELNGIEISNFEND